FSSMREPHVVGHSAAQKRSLCATGMPVSGAASPRAMRRSASRACARLFSRSTVMKALRRGLKRSMRSRQTRVSSTAEISLARSRLERVASVSPCMPGLALRPRLLDHLRYEVEAVLDLRRQCLEAFALIALGHAILAQPLARVLRMRHGLDGGSVD